jgi:hypothetical protein
MSLREELEDILVDTLEANFAWRSMMIGDKPDTTIKLSGPPQETLQAAVSALNAYCDALLKMVLRVAGAVDDLGDGGDVKTEGESP